MTRDGQGEEWIRAHADYPYADCCLIWPFGRNTTGYGMLTFAGEQTYAHRAMCQVVNGAPPSDIHQAAHSCERGHDACVSPRHLSWKTPAENQNDRTNMGGGPRRKLTAENADDIRACKGREHVAHTAERYGVTEAAVRQIQAGKLWRQSRQQQRIFTEDEVVRIRSTKGIVSAQVLADEFGVKDNVIYRIRDGRSYRYFPMTSALESAKGEGK